MSFRRKCILSEISNFSPKKLWIFGNAVPRHKTYPRRVLVQGGGVGGLPPHNPRDCMYIECVKVAHGLRDWWGWG